MDRGGGGGFSQPDVAVAPVVDLTTRRVRRRGDATRPPSRRIANVIDLGCVWVGKLVGMGRLFGANGPTDT